MKKRIVLLAAAALAIIVAAGSCTRDSAPPAGSCALPDTVSFSRHIQPLFNTYCSTAGCHTGNNPAGGLDLSAGQSYSQLSASGSGYLDTLNPKFSLLYSQMVSQSGPMPPTGRLDGCKQALVLKWIGQKAKNN